MPVPAPTVLLRQELRDCEAQIRRMGAAWRNKKDAGEFSAAEVSALWHAGEARRHLERIASDG